MTSVTKVVPLCGIIDHVAVCPASTYRHVFFPMAMG